ncbi:MAG: methyltransferase C-terminal domain-containing protein, partial [Candidatus Paceibacteria bacterium]
IARLIHLEEVKNLDKVSTYKSFAHKVEKLKTELVNLLSKLKRSGHTIAGYGAAAKGNTLLNYYGIGNDILDYIADQNTLKQGLYTPGTHVRVVSPKKIYQDTPDYIVILAWNFAQEIMKQQSDFRESGGKFILPVPEVRIA